MRFGFTMGGCVRKTNYHGQYVSYQWKRREKTNRCDPSSSNINNDNKCALTSARAIAAVEDEVKDDEEEGGGEEEGEGEGEERVGEEAEGEGEGEGEGREAEEAEEEEEEEEDNGAAGVGSEGCSVGSTASGWAARNHSTSAT